jgi:hypothetical protein
MLKPTSYFQWVRRDTESPSRVLQQWWTNWAARDLNLPPEQCMVGGEWRDVPMVPTVNPDGSKVKLIDPQPVDEDDF